MADERKKTEEERVGLCLTCRHMRRLETPRGSVFYQCGLAASDPAFPKYPRLPVIQCRGFMPGELPPARPRISRGVR